ncbi:hypothetical protein NQ317_013366 [Molorchus minor]|uniref:Peptidase S1 domain-containing protein n=1 Tax=Molorchus minor TaxID=1323400 RepID=A0ABQ9J1J5_9CUCU|nr:hypothetical protein NQ317_013366 [Molorchus minor]
MESQINNRILWEFYGTPLTVVFNIFSKFLAVRLCNMDKVFQTLLILTIYNGASSQLVSPCPRLFKYEPQSNENDRWYGELTLVSDAELTGVWLRIVFDKPSIQLGNWFGEVVTQDNKDYLVKNRNHKLLPNTPLKVRFYVKYDPSQTPPQLMSFRLNARTVCPEGGITTEAPTTLGQLLTSSELSTTSRPISSNQNTNGQTEVLDQGGGFTINNQGQDDDDFFHGDFAILNKPQKEVLNGACGVVIDMWLGWGFDETGKVTDELTKAQMPIVSQETCIYSFPRLLPRFTSDHTFCAGFQNGTSVCNGDSGGGMVFLRTGSNPQNPIWQLRGLVSISVALSK